MNMNYSYFLAAAEELNFNQAARRLFITEQCLSAHIKRAEDEYGVPLFVRKPKLALTDAGKMLYRELKQLDIAERNLEKRLLEYRDEKRGTIRFRIHNSTGNIIPHIIKQFWAEYPDITIDVEAGYSKSYSEILLNGEADLCIGSPLPPSPHIQSELLSQEYAYAAVSRSLLEKYYGDRTDDMISHFTENGMTLEELCEFPLFLPGKRSILMEKISYYCSEKKLQPSIMLHYAERSEAFDLAMAGFGAGVLSMDLGWGRGYLPCCKKQASNSPIYTFPIYPLDWLKREWYLHYSVRYEMPSYQKRLIEIIKESFQNKPCIMDEKGLPVCPDCSYCSDR